MSWKKVWMAFALLISGVGLSVAHAANEYTVGPGDVLRVSVFQNPDLTTESRVSEAGTINFPLVGAVKVGGRSPTEVEAAIASGLKSGGYVRDPQVNVLLLQVQGNQVSVLGRVNRPGRFPLEAPNIRIVDALAMGGGATEDGADIVTLVGIRDGTVFRFEVDIIELFSGGDLSKNIQVRGGDVLFIKRAPVYYIYGEVQRPGTYRLARNMTLVQALASGGGLTQRGTEKGVMVSRRQGNQVGQIKLTMDEQIQADDVIYVKESFF